MREKKKMKNNIYRLNATVVDLVKDVQEEYNPHKDFTTLAAWKSAQEIKLFFYREILTVLPPEEKFNLGLQIRKASISSTANISEGYGRFHFGEGIQFYRIARGSLYELKDHLISCSELKFISDKVFDKGLNLIESAKRMLNGYISYTRKKKTQFNDNNN